MKTAKIWDLDEHIKLIWEIHDKQASSKKNRVRLWDGKTPYAMHPIWCAMTLLSETSIEEEIRYDGALALLYHDVLEDTVAELKLDLSPQVVEWVRQMTFKGGFEQEKVELFKRSTEVKLLKLYDKTSNLLDGVWMPPVLRGEYCELTKKLCDDVKKNYGEINIVKISKSILGV